MVLVLVFGVSLMIAVLISGLAARTVISTSVLMLVAGIVVGPGVLGLVELTPHDPIESRVADLALFTVLFTDGQRLIGSGLRSTWRLGGRALLLGMPLTFGGITLLAHIVAGLDWTSAMLVGAILSPTDPVFASAIVGRANIPRRLRQLLNVESGLNDGLALPVVVVLIAVAGNESTELPSVLLELLGGIALGLALPALTAAIVRLPFVGAEARLLPLGPLSIAVVLYGLCHVTHANPYLAAFGAGGTLAALLPRASSAFEEFGELLSELTKLVALLLFGSLLGPMLVERLSWGDLIAAVLAILLVRPVALLLSLARAKLPRLELGAAAWFGPKGFASVVYALLALNEGIPTGQAVFDLVALCIALSIAVHSSTDVPVAKLFGNQTLAEATSGPDAGGMR